ncbi:MAG: GNAT family N-acetyltransferase [Acidimicrobiales bacterium]|nr:GNAT family N-acetyltransferase [Acidimicrobiales bacterium]MCB9395777.1 GNAT family N-acetyltransferase [Acidimicrobiaceae bacterium]
MHPIAGRPLEIRRITDHDDHERAGRLVRAAYDALGDLPEDDEYLDQLADVGSRRADADVIVALRDGRIVGCLTFVARADSDHHEFDDHDATSFRYFGVDPAAQGSGVGVAMVQWVIDETRRLGRPRVRIHTLREMVAAQRLYTRLGFVRTPELDEDWDGVEGIAYLYVVDGAEVAAGLGSPPV